MFPTLKIWLEKFTCIFLHSFHITHEKGPQINITSVENIYFFFFFWVFSRSLLETQNENTGSLNKWQPFCWQYFCLFIHARFSLNRGLNLSQSSNVVPIVCGCCLYIVFCICATKIIYCLQKILCVCFIKSSTMLF